jgi:hypothetical protein
MTGITAVISKNFWLLCFGDSNQKRNLQPSQAVVMLGASALCPLSFSHEKLFNDACALEEIGDHH